MTATAQHPELAWLEQQLKHRLVATVPGSAAWSVRCLLRQGKLVVLVQHPVSAESMPQRQVFGEVEAALREADGLPHLAARSPDLYAVRLYLRTQGEREPYGFYRFAWDASPSAEEPQPPPEDAVLEPSDPAIEPGDPAIEVETIAPSDILPPMPTPPPTSARRTPTVVDVDVAESKRLWYGRWLSRPASRIALSAGLAAGLILLGGGGYALSRPCVLRRCIPLETAQAHALEAAGKIEDGSSAQDVVDAYEALMEASYLLNQIPAWSQNYETAQTLLAAYETDARKLERVVQAQRLAMDAAIKSQNPPHPIVVWREIQQLWQGAIAQLEGVPADSPISDLAQRKQQEYEANLSQIEQRIRREVAAQEWVTVARQTATNAETRQDSASSLDDWRQVQADWQTVINALRNIPAGTMAHAEAQQLLALYRPQLQQTDERVSWEETGSQAISRATASAKSAEQAEERGQWNEAVAQWQRALTQAQQVQEGSTAYEQAQSMEMAYERALAEAQNRLQMSAAMRTALGDLDAICGSSPRLCVAERAGDRLRVTLTNDYERAIASTQNTTPVSTLRLDQMNPMLQAIASISETHTLPIELYEANNTLFGIYDPRVNGYVAELD